MLTLEQSNELRTSVQKVQKVQKFNQEVIKNKDIEIEEYKKQVDKKEQSLNKINVQNIELIEKISEIESSASCLSVEITSYKGDLSNLNQKYLRLYKIFMKHKAKYFNLKRKFNPVGLYANCNFIDELSNLIIDIESKNVSEIKSIVQEMLKLSQDDKWIASCHRLVIIGFLKSDSFNRADNYFDTLIRPFVKGFSEANLALLKQYMLSNNQISNRNQAEEDLKFVQAVITAKS